MDVNLFMPRSDDTCESHGISNGQLLEILGNGFSNENACPQTFVHQCTPQRCLHLT